MFLQGSSTSQFGDSLSCHEFKVCENVCIYHRKAGSLTNLHSSLLGTVNSIIHVKRSIAENENVVIKVFGKC